MDKIRNEFNSSLNLMREYREKIKTLSVDKEGFYENKDHEIKAS
jgi:hypothetical protein